MIAIGIDLGGTNIKSALVDREKGIITSHSIPTEAHLGVDHVVSRIVDAIKLAESEAPEKPVGVGIGSPGSISLDRTKVMNPPNFPGWETVEMSKEIFERTGFKALVDNDANLAALGSSRFGAGKGFDSMIMVTLGTGVGGGIILNGELYRGSTGAAGELGHTTIDYHGPMSNSMVRGCVEAFLGQRFLSRYAADRIIQEPKNPLYTEFKNDFEALEPVHLFNEAQSGNELAIDILRKTGEKLGYGILNYVHVLDIRKVVVSGGVSKAGDYILEPARKTALAYMLPPFKENFEVIYEPLGNDAALLGAASLAFEYLTEKETAQASV